MANADYPSHQLGAVRAEIGASSPSADNLHGDQCRRSARIKRGSDHCLHSHLRSTHAWQAHVRNRSVVSARLEASVETSRSRSLRVIVRLDPPKWSRIGKGRSFHAQGHGANLMNTSHAVFPVSPESSELDAVFALYRTHSGTLGFLPRGAFEQYASEGHILGYQVDGVLAGYVAYRVATTSVVLVHLCVSRQHRGKGIASALMNALLQAVATTTTMRLSCRHDYVEANALWPRFGFICRGERPGRGSDAARLYRWERRVSGELPLLELMQEADLESRKRVVLDANVFFDLYSDEARAVESRALLADWIEPEVALCVTAELRNEISRQPNGATRTARYAQISNFEMLEGAPADVTEMCGTIAKFLPPPTCDSDESDRRQLAHAIVKGAD